jgi:hypothetical protein
MKQFKIILLVIVLGSISLIIYQNLDFFSHREMLGMNLYFWQYESQQLTNGVLFFALFLIGFLLSYFSSLSVRFKANKKIKALNSINDSQQEMIEALKNKLEVFQKVPDASGEESLQSEGSSENPESNQENSNGAE